MLTRRRLLAASFFLAFAVPAGAAERQAFTRQAFAAAQAAGRPSLVHIHAPWCPTCRAQEPILEKLQSDPKFEGLKVFRVDFDSQKDAVRAFRATTQSTLIVFRGAKETGRSVGDTNPASIAALLDKAL
jgi:thiol-disulfide isomerase/thioredoxin